MLDSPFICMYALNIIHLTDVRIIASSCRCWQAARERKDVEASVLSSALKKEQYANHADIG